MARYILIDKDRLRLVKATPTYMQAEYWSAIKCRNRDTLLCGTQRKDFSAFSEMELKQLWADYRGADPHYKDYADLLAQVVHLVEQMPLDETTVEKLAAKLGHELTGLTEVGEQSSYQPSALSKTGRTRKVAEPQSTTTPEESTMSKSKRKAGKVNGKADRIEKNGIVRPRPGGNTAAVWEACDKVQGKLGKKRAPAFSEVDAVLGKSPTIPQTTRRANYAAWRKFHGIKGRITVE